MVPLATKENIFQPGFEWCSVANRLTTLAVLFTKEQVQNVGSSFTGWLKVFFFFCVAMFTFFYTIWDLQVKKPQIHICNLSWLWNVRNGNLIMTLEKSAKQIQLTLNYAGDGDSLASTYGREEGYFCIWDCREQK